MKAMCPDCHAGSSGSLTRIPRIMSERDTAMCNTPVCNNVVGQVSVSLSLLNFFPQDSLVLNRPDQSSPHNLCNRIMKVPHRSGFEGVHEPLIAARDLFDGGGAGNP